MQTSITAHLLKRIAQGFIAIVLVASPLPFGSVQDSWIFALEVAGCMLLALWAAIQLAEGETSLVRTRLAWPALALALYLILTLVPLSPRIIEAVSTETNSIQRFASEALSSMGYKFPIRHTLSLAPFETEGEILKMATYAIFLFAGLDILRYRRGYISVTYALIAGGTAVATLGILQNIWGNGKIYWVFPSGSVSPFGPFVNKNHFAGYMELLIGLALGLLLAEIYSFKKKAQISGSKGFLAWIWHPRGYRVWLLVLSNFVMLAALTASLSRGAMVSFLAAGLLFVVRALMAGRKPSAEPGAQERRDWRKPAVWLLACSIAVVALMTLSPRVRERWAEIRHPDTKYRLEVWQDTATAIADFSLTGSGLGSFRTVFPRYKTGYFHSESTHAESEYLEWQLETGVIGSLLFAALALALARQVIFRLGSRKNLTARSLGYGALFSLACISIHNAMDFNMHIPSNALTATAVVCICLVAINTRAGQNGDRFMLEVSHTSLAKPKGIAMLVLVVLACGLLGQRAWAHYNSRLLADSWVRQREFLLKGDPDESQLALLSDSIRANAWNDRSHYMKAATYLSAARDKGLAQLIQRNRLLETAESEIAMALRCKPASGLYWALLANVRAVRRDSPAAEVFYKQALHLARSDGQTHQDYGLFLLEKGDLNAAAARLLTARTYEPGINLLDVLRPLAARTADRRIWQQVVRYHPDDLNAYAYFLHQSGFQDLAAQFYKQAAELQKARSENAGTP